MRFKASVLVYKIRTEGVVPFKYLLLYSSPDSAYIGFHDCLQKIIKSRLTRLEPEINIL